MFQILEAYGILQKLLNAIKIMYENTKAKVIARDGETEFIKRVAGVLQGDTRTPYLFAIVLDYAMRKAIDGKEE